MPLDSLSKLQVENARLIALLESHGIEWRSLSGVSPPSIEPSKLSTNEKVALFRRLFRGRTDIYPRAMGEQDNRQIRLCTCLRQ